MRTLSLAALGAATLLAGAAAVHTADAASHRSHTSHTSHTSHAGASGSGTSADGAGGASAGSPGITAGNGLVGCSTLAMLPLVNQLPLPTDPTGSHLAIGDMPGVLGIASACR